MKRWPSSQSSFSVSRPMPEVQPARRKVLGVISRGKSAAGAKALAQHAGAVREATGDVSPDEEPIDQRASEDGVADAIGDERAAIALGEKMLMLPEPIGS